MSTPTRHSLIDAVRSGNDQDKLLAWNRLWSVYRDYVHYRIYRGGAEHNDIDDISQDVFATVAQRIDEFKINSRTGSFRAWLGLIVRHRIADYYRGRERSPGADRGSGRTDALRFVEDASSLPDEGQDASEDAQVRLLYERALTLAFAEFEEATVTMFRQAVADERSTADIAAEHGVSPAAVRMAKSRVLRRLRVLLGESAAPDDEPV
jgi:RNA polymerase sigma-70 factor (ECF subfamily)